MSATEAKYRTKYIEVDTGREPKTDYFCVRCQKDMRSNQRYRTVHLVDGGPFVLHPQDEGLYVSDSGEMGWHCIGLDCAAIIGIEWTHAPKREKS